ncbi:MBL fold metallo-hydrolase RNA specificity domain-containing protein [Marinospirillum alkaliphilum]|uniref:Metallo-beta-lactamase family protein n=1 Tax=Marinospirillum alkaliphilum DSM 21637 TaxID=1122209 RepID=A0A1K1ZJ49_9GAMM|nr:MBL fold metallo-hydrolase [Marinospirillum alkaliphilum]SFX73716.1 metallo-beta-lactamase family protein [Marinospirillum alkaliphilum DSM 21637]
MHIEFLGAAQEVTGSCHLVQVGRSRILLDCGLMQGGGKAREEEANGEPFPFDPASIDAVVLSHSHLDHCGRIPVLVKEGFKGKIYTQRACQEMCRVMFMDAAHIAERDAFTQNRKRERKGLPLIEPLFTTADAEKALRHFRGMDYDSPLKIADDVVLRLFDAGHILGSAIVQLDVEEKGHQRRIVFSGDLGHAGAPILRNPTFLKQADVVLMESTYGGRCHRSWEESFIEMGEVLKEARQSGGNVLIPAFAVGRTQELLYLFAKHYKEWGVADWQIYLDSPMAIEATEVYANHSHLYDAETRELWAKHQYKDLLPNLHITRSPDESMQINNIRKGAIIIAGSGMCEGGRIRHHLKNHVWREGNHLVFVGFQARNTLGRRIIEGATTIKLWGEEINVAARVHTIGGFSAHADQKGLIDWYRHFEDAPALLLVHGETESQQALIEAIKPWTMARAPSAGQQLDLLDPFSPLREVDAAS